MKKANGVYHIGGNDLLTPCEMACKTAGYLGLDMKLINRVLSADFLRAARRPAKTGLAIDKARAELGFEPISFEE